MKENERAYMGKIIKMDYIDNYEIKTLAGLFHLSLLYLFLFNPLCPPIFYIEMGWTDLIPFNYFVLFFVSLFRYETDKI